MEAYFEIVLAIGINAASIDKSIGEYAFPGVQISNACAIFFALVSLILPIFILKFY